MRTGRAGGFTLIELLVAIAIIGILASIVTPAMIMAQERARRSSDQSSLHNITLACLQYASQSNEMLPPGRRHMPPDDYTWVNFDDCWDILCRQYGLTMDMVCSSEAGAGFKPDPTVIEGDTRLGWVYWGGREPIAAGDGTVAYTSPVATSDWGNPTSQTLMTCLCYDSQGQAWESVAPHVRTKLRLYGSGAPLKPAPDGLAVSRMDGSCNFVPWSKLKTVSQGACNLLYYQPDFDER